MSRRVSRFVGWMLLLPCAGCVKVGLASQTTFIEGAFSVIYGDPSPPRSNPSIRFFLALGPHHTVELGLDSLLQSHASSLVRFDRAQVRAQGRWITRDSLFQAIRLDSMPTSRTKR